MGNDPEKVILAVSSNGDYVVGRVRSVVLRSIGVTARKFGLAVKRGFPVTVLDGSGVGWTIRELELLRSRKKG